MNDRISQLELEPSIQMTRKQHILQRRFNPNATLVIYHGDCRSLLNDLPNGSVKLVVTSPPYNLGKEYERRVDLQQYVEQQSEVIRECARVLDPQGNICWQVGNYVSNGRIHPLDSLLYPVFEELGLQLRNRIVWHFEHGLHCKNRFSGRYETINWYTKNDDYTFNLDPVRVPQKYPGKKHFKGPNAGKYSGNPLGKNPGDVWEIPNVKSNHIEKTEHPCQFPVELVERLVLSMSNSGDWVLDPFMGGGTSVVAALKHNRRGIGAELHKKYCRVAEKRVADLLLGKLKTRPMNKPVYDPVLAGNSLTKSPWSNYTEDQRGILDLSGSDHSDENS